MITSFVHNPGSNFLECGEPTRASSRLAAFEAKTPLQDSSLKLKMIQKGIRAGA
jgi:hypothetical protein